MSKNMIRKGLALGLGTALLTSAIVASPAIAAVDDSAVSLVPFAGTEYSMVTDGYFDLKSTQSTAAATGTPKISYKVTDAGSISKFDYAADIAANTSAEVLAAANSYNVDTGMTVAYVASTDVVTLTATGASGTANGTAFVGYAIGDVFSITGLAATGITTAFTGLAEVMTNTTNDVLTFKLPTLATTGSADLTTIAVSAGTFREVSDNVELDSYEIISAGSLGTGVTTLTAPGRETDGSYVVVGPDADSTKTDLLRLVASKAGTVTVQAWIDNNSDGIIDSTENASSVRTVTFVTWANSGAALNIETPVAGSDWETYVSFNSTINAAQILSTRLKVALGVLDRGVLEPGATTTTADGSKFTGTSETLVFDDAVSHVDNFWGKKVQVDTVLTSSNTAASNFTAGFTYAGQIFLDGVAYGNIVYTNIGNAVADAVGAVAATRGDNVLQSSTTVTVKEDYTGEVEFKVLLTVADATVAGNPTGAGAGKVAVAAGTEATIKIAKGSLLDADSTITSGGKTLTSTSVPSSISYTGLTDANGYVTFTLSNDEAVVGDDLNITVTHAGAAVSADVTWAAPVATSSVLSGAAVVSTVAKDTWSIEYTAVDSYGAPLTGSTYRVSAVYYTKIGGVATTTGVNLDASGKGTLTVTDASTATGNFAVVGTLQKLNTSAVYADFGTPTPVNSTVYVVTDKTPAAVTIVETITSSDGDPALELVAAVNVDATAPNGATAPAVAGGEKTVISGVVTTSAGAAVRGTVVTVSAPGLFFKSGDVYSVGSATTVTSSTGAYSVDVRSNLAGEQIVTVTAGAATKTKSIGFDAAAGTAGASLVVDAPANVGAGSSFTVKVSLKDAFGNPVMTTAGFALSYSGAGIALSVPSNTNANGEASFAVLLGTNDTAAGVITATYDADATASTVDNNYSVVKMVNGATATKVNAGSFKGYVAVYAKGYEGSRLSAKVGKDWVIVPSIPASTNDLYRYVEFVGPGVDIAVRIYIDRVLVDTINLVTK